MVHRRFPTNERRFTGAKLSGGRGIALAAGLAALICGHAAQADDTDTLIAGCVAAAGVVGQYQIQYVSTGVTETASVPPALAVSPDQSRAINDCIARGGVPSGRAYTTAGRDRSIGSGVLTGPCKGGVFRGATGYCIRDASERVITR